MNERTNVYSLSQKHRPMTLSSSDAQSAGQINACKYYILHKSNEFFYATL